MTDSNISNRLGKEASLYLRQHEENPVAWQPWDDEALALARETGRPILLSIGYSACHWCHVMAHESFEDQDTAKVMNDLYVNIKVDREERPDLDKIYQLSHQLLTGRGGGWPLTLFLDPVNQIPFFAGTYFPLQPRYGMPSFKEVLVRAREWFDQKPDEMNEQSERLQKAIESMQQPPPAEAIASIAAADDTQTLKLASKAAKDLLSRYDPIHGGFGGAPKFPGAPILELAAAISLSDSGEASEIGSCLHTTLENMGNSGLRDHLDGGFFRYCVDGSWTIPHFEKMLYDNAQLLPLYAEAAAASGRHDFEMASAGIVAWLKREMLQTNGAFSASIDADADGEEGGFHVWTKEQVRQLLDDEQLGPFSEAYGLDGPPNFEDEAWHLVGQVESRDDPETLKAARETLRIARESRVHPTLDEKQITSWNALTATGLLRAARALAVSEWTSLAQDTLDFIRKTQWDGSRLLAVHNQGQSRFSGYLDDYAFTLQACLESLRTSWRRDDLDFAIHIADAMLVRFEDEDNGGFYFTDTDQPTPIARSVVMQDDATPAAYPAAIIALHDLAGLVGNLRYLKTSEKALDRALPGTENSPMAFAGVTRACLSLANPRPQLVIAGTSQEETSGLKRWAESHFPVNCYRVDEAGEDTVHGKGEKPLPGILAEFNTDKPVTAWLCLGMKCLPPVNSRAELKVLLEQ